MHVLCITKLQHCKKNSLNLLLQFPTSSASLNRVESTACFKFQQWWDLPELVTVNWMMWKIEVTKMGQNYPLFLTVSKHRNWFSDSWPNYGLLECSGSLDKQLFLTNTVEYRNLTPMDDTIFAYSCNREEEQMVGSDWSYVYNLFSG